MFCPPPLSVHPSFCPCSHLCEHTAGGPTGRERQDGLFLLLSTQWHELSNAAARARDRANAAARDDDECAPVTGVAALQRDGAMHGLALRGRQCDERYELAHWRHIYVCRHCQLDVGPCEPTPRCVLRRTGRIGAIRVCDGLVANLFGIRSVQRR